MHYSFQLSVLVISILVDCWCLLVLKMDWFLFYDGGKPCSIWFCVLQKLDEAAVQGVFLKSLDNYIKWCNYLVLQPVWSKYESIVLNLPIIWFQFVLFWSFMKQMLLHACYTSVSFADFILYYFALFCWELQLLTPGNLHCAVWSLLTKKRSCYLYHCTSLYGVKLQISDSFPSAYATYFIMWVDFRGVLFNMLLIFETA